jgi:hypothetical protein
MDDYLFENLSTVQSDKQPLPPTLASDTTIAPTTRCTYVTGTAQIKTITPPIPNAYHELILIFTDASPGTTLTTGNISQAIVPTTNLPTFLFWNVLTQKYTGCASNLT